MYRAHIRYKKYKLITVIWYFLSLVSFCVFIGIINLASILADMICCAVIGFFLVGLVPISFNFSGEMAYPESEATSSALLQSSGDMLGVLIIEISKYLVQLDPGIISGKQNLLIKNMTFCISQCFCSGPMVASIFLIGCLLFGLILMLFVTEDLRRYKASTISKAAIMLSLATTNLASIPKTDYGTITTVN